jgi:hypothetical protein
LIIASGGPGHGGGGGGGSGGRPVKPTKKLCQKATENLAIFTQDTEQSVGKTADDIAYSASAEIGDEESGDVAGWRHTAEEQGGSLTYGQAIQASQTLGKLGVQALNTFRTRGGKLNAQALAAQGLSELAALMDSAETLLRACTGVKGVTEQMLNGMKYLLDRADVDSETWGSFLAGVSMGRA